MVLSKRFLAVCTLVLLGAMQTDAWALSLGGGHRNRGGTGPRKDPKKEQEGRDREAHKQHIQQMPQLEKCAALDSSILDRFIDQVNPSKEQMKRIDELKQRIRDRAQELEKDEDKAKDNFKNSNEAGCPQAGATLMAAIQSCKNYVSKQEYEKGVWLILSESQRAKVKLLQEGKHAEIPDTKKGKVPDE